MTSEEEENQPVYNDLTLTQMLQRTDLKGKDLKLHVIQGDILLQALLLRGKKCKKEGSGALWRLGSDEERSRRGKFRIQQGKRGVKYGGRNIASTTQTKATQNSP